MSSFGTLFGFTNETVVVVCLLSLANSDRLQGAEDSGEEEEEEDWADAEAGPTQQSMANPLAASSLPPGWTEHWSNEQRQPYWTNAAGQSTWTRPLSVE
jgi:hypothetical protein